MVNDSAHAVGVAVQGADHLQAGADNLLLRCAKVQEGSKLLLVNEIGRPSVDHATIEFIERRAVQLGAKVRSIWWPSINDPSAIGPEIRDAIAASDVTIFNHGLGAMLRFHPLPGKGLGVLNYATHSELLESEWARIPFGIWERTIVLIARELAKARQWRITCPNGTDLTGTVANRADATAAAGDGFTLVNFPFGTHAPFSTAQASGRIVLRWLLSSQNHYNGPGLRLGAGVVATVKEGRIIAIEGAARETERLQGYLSNVGKQTKADPFIVNSWHAGVNPQAFTPWRDVDDLATWHTLTHNNPRTLHFHVVGAEVPGELSAPIIDHTVEIDGTVLWDRGRLTLLERPEFQAAVAEDGDASRVFRLNPAIGIA